MNQTLNYYNENAAAVVTVWHFFAKATRSRLWTVRKNSAGLHRSISDSLCAAWTSKNWIMKRNSMTSGPAHRCCMSKNVESRRFSAKSTDHWFPAAICTSPSSARTANGPKTADSSTTTPKIPLKNCSLQKMAGKSLSFSLLAM